MTIPLQNGHSKPINGHANGHKVNGVKDSYKVVEEPMGTGRTIKVITIGAGASGLNLQREFDTSFPEGIVDHVIYEKNAQIGGTWFENKYPGCACDIPSVNYQYTWNPAEWTKYYSGAPEILKYFQATAEKYKLARNVRVKHLLIHAQWDEEDKMWHVKLQRNNDPNDVIEDSGHVLVNATGVLNKWTWPDIKGRASFKGGMCHSAAWDESIDLKGKRVAVIGSGSSGIQIVPTILPEVKSLLTFVRTPTWITAGFAQRFAGENGANFEYTPEQRKIFREDPAKYLLYRKNIESELNSRFKMNLNGTAEQEEVRAFAEAEMRKKLEKRPEIADVIVPKDFYVGCRRPTPGSGYLEALCDDKVTVVPSHIDYIDEKGLYANGKYYELDVIICATGFDVTWRPRYPLIGREGRELSKEWSEGAVNYLSITTPHFPNYFTFMGPYAPYGHASVLPLTEHYAKHLSQMIHKMAYERVTSFDVSQDATDDWMEHRRTFIPRTAWAGNCRSWFKQGCATGDVMMWPGSRLHFFDALNKVRWEDYHLTTLSKNRFAFLGNGFHANDLNGTDRSYYLGLVDGKREQPDYSDDKIKEFFVVPV